MGGWGLNTATSRWPSGYAKQNINYQRLLNQSSILMDKLHWEKQEEYLKKKT